MALANLAASYSDSESGEDDHESKGKVPVAKESTSITADDTPKEQSYEDNISDSDEELTTEGANFFKAESDDSSSSDSEDDNDDSDSKDNLQSKLPNPLAVTPLPSAKDTLLHGSSEGSVFGNRFAQEEKAKKALYEKHVKMTEDRITSQPHCFKFRKGFCRKGDKCRFRHDLGLQVPSYNCETDTKALYEAAVIQQPPGPSLPQKKKVGVTNTLYPAKKAKTALNEQRAKERPWTVQE